MKSKFYKQKDIEILENYYISVIIILDIKL